MGILRKIIVFMLFSACSFYCNAQSIEGEYCSVSECIVLSSSSFVMHDKRTSIYKKGKWYKHRNILLLNIDSISCISVNPNEKYIPYKETKKLKIKNNYILKEINDKPYFLWRRKIIYKKYRLFL